MSDSPVGKGPIGPAGPSTPSADAGNLLTLGGDSLLYYPGGGPAYVDTPVNISPPAGYASQPVADITFTNTRFNTANSVQAPLAGQWQIATDQAFTNVVYDSGSVFPSATLETFTASVGLEGGTSYWWRTRQEGDESGFGSWSVATSFTTKNLADLNVVSSLGGAYLHAPGAPNWQAAFSCSVWVEVPTAGNYATIFSAYRNGTAFNWLYLRFSSTNQIEFYFGATDTTRRQWNTLGTYPAGSFINIMLAETANVAPKLYVNDVQVIPSVITTSNLAAFIVSGVNVCSWTNGSLLLNSPRISNVWVDDVFRDFSVEANRRLFLTADLQPVYLGVNGEIPFGVSPNVFFGSAYTAAGWNSGVNLGRITTSFASGVLVFTDVVNEVRAWYEATSGYLLKIPDVALVNALSSAGIDVNDVLTAVSMVATDPPEDYIDIQKVLIEILDKLP